MGFCQLLTQLIFQCFFLQVWEYFLKFLYLFLSFVKDLAAGLEHIHNLGFSHNDIKIDNCIICLNENGEQTLKLIDFETMGEHKTNETRVIGTRRYFSPECHRNINQFLKKGPFAYL